MAIIEQKESSQVKEITGWPQFYFHIISMTGLFYHVFFSP